MKTTSQFFLVCSDKTVATSTTASTETTESTCAETVEGPSSLSSVEPLLGQPACCAEAPVKKSVHWMMTGTTKATTSTATNTSPKSESARSLDAHFERMSLAKIIKNSPKESPEEHQRKAKELEEKIQQAARTELRYLNEAKLVKQKLDSFLNARTKLQNVPATHDSPERQLEITQKIEKVDMKIEKAKRMEVQYLKKSKQLRDKRYRWTQLYIRGFQDLRASGELKDIRELPPLMPATIEFMALRNGTTNLP